MMRERGLAVDHVAIFRRVQRYAPEINKRMRPHLKMSGASFRIGETYVKVGKEWKYLHRAVDKDAATIEFTLSAKRDISAAKRFFKKMLRADHRRLPFTIGTDKHASNPVDGTSFFVRQHYRDFFSRDPDAAGLAFWTGEIEQCGADASCREVRRISVSQAFFFSIEFQRTGYRVFRLYRATFPDAAPRPRGMPLMAEFLRDTQEVGRGVIVGQGAWEEQLRQNVADFARRWVARAEVRAQLPETLTAEQFVDKLFANSGVTPTAQEREEALAAYGAGGAEGRAAALLSVTDSPSAFNAQYNPAFVYMQYAAYLRRHPTETPDADFEGFDFWLAKLDSFTQPGEDARDETVAVRRARRAEMVKAFITSDEYQKRFGQ